MVMHQYREGNSAIDFLAKERERENNKTYDDHYCLPLLLKEITRVDMLGLPSFRK